MAQHIGSQGQPAAHPEICPCAVAANRNILASRHLPQRATHRDGIPRSWIQSGIGKVLDVQLYHDHIGQIKLVSQLEGYPAPRKSAGKQAPGLP